jgi:Flp pilus assembly protein TadD
LALLNEADALKPDDGNIKYNLGLVYFELRDYDQARVHARQAAELGFPLTGLRQKLEKSGQWRN